MPPLTKNELTGRIMRRVYAVWFWRRVAPILALELSILAGVAVGVLTQISPRHILLNALTASGDAFTFIQFFIDNFLVKSIQSQLLVAAYAFITAVFIRDLRSALRRMHRGGDELLPLIVSSETHR